ncbi:uncharacterized protein [Nicotiana tomentosiformis]|uniref:uncharacterized protein n=1 Tax=Nicotiana tomentosiformis TaxID=4098 RepID=UPI00388CD012
MQFNSLAKYAPLIVAEMSHRVHRFVGGLGPHLINECTTASLSPSMDIARIQAYAQSLEDWKRVSVMTESPIPVRVRIPEGIAHSIVKPGHIICFCPARNVDSVIPPTGSVEASSSTAHPREQGIQLPMGRGRGRRRMSSPNGQQQNCIYALSGRQNLESSPDMVVGILSVFSLNVYALIDPGSTLSYISPFVASSCGKKPELLRQLFEVSTPVGESVVVRRVYRGCDVMIHNRHTLADLNRLEMIEFDVIMGIDWLASCYATVDCWKKDVRFNFLGEPVIEWKGNVATPKWMFISYLKA